MRTRTEARLRTGCWIFVLVALILLILAIVSNRNAEGQTPGAKIVRPYHPVAISDFARSKFTHVRTIGVVELSKMEQDGDHHIRIGDGAGHFIVAEVIPALPIAGSKAIKKGDRVTVWGIRRHDDEHGWWEVHPVEGWSAK